MCLPTAERGLLALSVTPGLHHRLFDDSVVVASALRRELGLASAHDRVVLAVDRPRYSLRQLRMRLRRRVAERGRLSRWGLALLAYRAFGAYWAAAVFYIRVLPTVALYLFLWPAMLLVSGLRSVIGMRMGCRTRTRKWYDTPGGELSLVGAGPTLSGRRLAVLMLLPRFLAFGCVTATLVIVLWRTNRLGVISFPILYTRPDELTNVYLDSLFVAPYVLFADLIIQEGVKGIGLAAGLGVGLMALPTYREIHLVRLHAGHDAGRGSRLGRAITRPLSMASGALAVLEAVLPFRGGPLYLTTFLVLPAVAFAIAGGLVTLLP